MVGRNDIIFSGYKSQRTTEQKRMKGKKSKTGGKGERRQKRGEGITEKPLETQNREQKKKHRDEQQQEKRRGRTPISWVQTSITIDHRLRLRLRFPIISQATA
jgi:hypothetical protein